MNTFEEESIDQRNSMREKLHYSSDEKPSEESIEEAQARMKKLREELEATHFVKPLVDIWNPV